MRIALRPSWFLAASLLLVPGPALAQKADVKAEVLKDWTDMKDTMVKIANEMPEDKFGYKSTPPQRSYGEQILHVAGANANFLKALGGKATAPTINTKATSKAEIVKALEESFDYGIAAINEQTSDTILEQVKVPPFMGGMASRARVVNFLIGHAWDIYGQMAVYLRLNGQVPPRSQRP
jgi:uncharacterized damage-inducible protein DinB